MEIRMLKSFVAVVEYGSFTEAANRLFLSQPTISSHIKLLEDELQIKLIQRNTKTIHVTEKGREVFSYAQKIIALENDLLKDLNSNKAKRVKIGASSIPSAHCLPEMLCGYKNSNNDIDFDVKQGDSFGIIDSLKDGIIDIGLIGMEYKSNDIECSPFYQDKMVVIAPNTKEFQKIKTLKIKEQLPLLLEKPYITREDGSASRAFGQKILEDNGYNVDELNITAHVNSQEAIVNLVKSGFGISISSSKSVEDEVKNGSIIEFNILGKKNERNLNLIYYKEALKNKHINKIVEFFKTYYSKK